MCRVGHAFIKKQMHETGAWFAGELSTHYYFRDFAKQAAKERKTDPKAGFLKETDAWTDPYFAGDREALRLAFFP